MGEYKGKRPNKNPDVPGTFKEPPECRWDGCSKPGFNWLKITLEIMDRETNARFPFCDEHFKVVSNDQGAYSISPRTMASK